MGDHQTEVRQLEVTDWAVVPRSVLGGNYELLHCLVHGTLWTEQGFPQAELFQWLGTFQEREEPEQRK